MEPCEKRKMISGKTRREERGRGVEEHWIIPAKVFKKVNLFR